MKKSAKLTTESSMLCPLKNDGITGVDSIDAQIIQFDPGIIKNSEEENQIIAEAIISYWFGDAKSIERKIINNENIIEYIDGIKEIIIYENTIDIAGLQGYIQESIISFDPIKICNNT